MDTSQRRPPWWLCAATVLLAVTADLASKAWAHGSGYSGPLVEPAKNDELALGVASFDAGLLPLLTLGAASLFVLAYGFRLSRESRAAAILFGLLVGGVAGNAINRAAKGSVHDWLDIWVAIANLADVFIIAGLIWFVVAAWRSIA